MKQNNVLVTGGAGFIGSHLVDALVEDNTVHVVDDLSAGKHEFLNDDAVFHEVDVRDRDALAEVFGEPDVVFHLAADAHTRKTSAGWKDPQRDLDVNARGTLNVLQVLQDQTPDAKLVYASSAAVYGNPVYAPMDEAHPTNPISPYGIHKLAGEKYVNAFVAEQGLDGSSIRIFNTFGPRQPRYVMYDFLKKLQADNAELEVLGTGQQIRDYCYVHDTVQAFLTVATHGAAGAAYNLSGNNVISIGDLAALMIDLVGLDTDIRFTEESWKGDPSRLEADISKLQDLGFKPGMNLEDGLQRFIDYFEQEYGPVTQ